MREIVAAQIELYPLFEQIVSSAWSVFERAGSVRVIPSVPVLFFGDLHAYFASKRRVLTVGKNPSLREFPSPSPFQRFPKADRIGHDEIERYLNALSDYFRTDPYRSWFSAFESLLNGMGASYYDCPTMASTALHTDICSPVATDPTWNRLEIATRDTLTADGCSLWHELIGALRPQVVVLSFKRDLLSRIRFGRLTKWEVICRFDRKKDDELRRRPYDVCASWHAVSDEPSLFLYGPAMQKPLGSIGDRQKRRTGEVALEKWRREYNALR